MRWGGDRSVGGGRARETSGDTVSERRDVVCNNKKYDYRTLSRGKGKGRSLQVIDVR